MTDFEFVPLPMVHLTDEELELGEAELRMRHTAEVDGIFALHPEFDQDPTFRGILYGSGLGFGGLSPQFADIAYQVSRACALMTRIQRLEAERLGHRISWGRHHEPF